MSISLTSSGAIGRFVDRNLRGVGQVMLQNNSLTGLLFLVGIFINNWVFGLYALFGTVVATESALLFGAPRDAIKQGLYGLNGTLVAVGLAFYMQQSDLLPVYVFVAAIFSTVLMAAIQDIFGAKGHALTAPFVVMTWVFIAAVYNFSRLHVSPVLGVPHVLTPAAASIAVWSPVGILTGISNGVAQVMLQQNPWTGLVFLIALAVNSRIACAAALLGSAIAFGIAWSLGAAPDAIRDGLYGFNAVLTAIALGGTFLRLRPAAVVLAILGVCVSTVLYAGLVTTLSPLGLPVLTAPFVVTTWLCLVAVASLTRVPALSDGSDTREAPIDNAQPTVPGKKK